MRNLDDVELLRRCDPHGMLSLLEGFQDHCENARRLASSISLPARYGESDKLVMAGLGGSAIGGALLRSLLIDEVDFPIITCRNYTIPRFVNQNTLFFATSYSGNTEETLSAYTEAKKAGARLIVVTTGGKLRDYAVRDDVPCVVIPSGMPPRAAIPYLLLVPLIILWRLKMINGKEWELDELRIVLGELREELGPPRPKQSNLAKQTAMKLYGLVPLIYGVEGRTDVVAYRWKTQFNENAKVPAFSHLFPELNHNEIVGWDALKDINKGFGLMVLVDGDETPPIKRRIEITTSLMKERVGFVKTIFARGKGRLAKILSLIYIGDFISVYLAILNGIDPYPVKIIDYLKEQLAKEG